MDGLFGGCVGCGECDKCLAFGCDDPQVEQSERRHFQAVLAAYNGYHDHALQRVSEKKTTFSNLSPLYQDYLEGYDVSIKKMEWCIDQNDVVVKDIISNASGIFFNVSNSLIDSADPRYQCTGKSNNPVNDKQNGESSSDAPKIEDFEKVHSVLKHFVRDWSSEGEYERKQCYTPIIDEIQKEFPNAKGVDVLVPGAGLGRLTYEIATRGYNCQGNDFSLFMIFASNYVLNKCHKINGCKIYPWVHQPVNFLSSNCPVKEVKFPDVNPHDAADADFSMVAGDFLEVYNEPCKWNCVATCFFIDCAPNIILLLEKIYEILKPGGIWVNLGPLLYHYSDLSNENSIEPPFDILCIIMKKIGFVMEFQKTGVKTKYVQNSNSMMQCEYDSVFFLCRKPGFMMTN